MRRLALVMGFAALCCGSVAFAHHSFALFDRTQLTTLSGTVREWKWANPHTWLTVTVRKADGTDEDWALVGSSPNMMIRWGWRYADIKIGDKLTIDTHPARDGSPQGSVFAVYLADGRVLADPMGRRVSGDDLAKGPPPVPSKPTGEPYR